MADTVVHMGENSPEQVAYRLLGHVMNSERMSFNQNPSEGYKNANRKYILDTYAECLKTVRQPWDRDAGHD